MAETSESANMEGKNPLIEALPPATDYITYLTIVEYNLTTENLPTLHEILQDTKLTVNIGWDLVHLLVPLLPASEQCLQDIARLGNPREVILKVTESLQVIDFDEPEDLAGDEGEDASATGSTTNPQPTKTAAVGSSAQSGNARVTQAVEVGPPPPLPVLQFTSLLSMLSILHPRIKTSFPSRFLSTSLMAVLSSFSRSTSHREELVSAVIRLVKNVSGLKRPHLPPRKSSAMLATACATPAASDPEADTQASQPSLDETAIQSRLLQSFATHIMEEYTLGLPSNEDITGLAWCVRMQEKLHPERLIPGTRSMSERFASDEALQARLTTVGDILALVRDLNLKTADLWTALHADEQSIVQPVLLLDESEHPKSVSDIPLSQTGSFFLFTARHMVNILYSARVPDSSFSIFPDHFNILSTFVSNAITSAATIGTEAEALLDAVLAFGLLAIEGDRIGEPKDSDEFNNYLQILSLISSNCPSPSLRYQAFYLTSTVLRSNPSDVERLAFIRDTLEHCPFDNLKVAGVSWIKGEIIEANPPPGAAEAQPKSSEEASVFSTPVALDTLAPFLFPDLTHDLTLPNIENSWQFFDQNLHFYLASLNLYYLLLSATHLHKAIAIGDLHTNNDIAGCFLQPLRDASSQFREAGKEGGRLHGKWAQDGDVAGRLAELAVLDDTLEKVSTAVARLNVT